MNLAMSGLARYAFLKSLGPDSYTIECDNHNIDKGCNKAGQGQNCGLYDLLTLA